MVKVNRKYTAGKFHNISLGCKHAVTTNLNLDSAALTPLEKQYLNKLHDVTQGGFLDVVGGLITRYDGNTSWSSADVFFNCHNDPADWNAYKSALSSRNTSIPKLVGDELAKRGIVVNFDKQDAPVFQTVSYPVLAAAANSAINGNSGVTPAFSTMANSYNFGDLDDDIKTFMANPENGNNIRDAVKVLNYVVPTSNDPIDIMKFKQIYWGAYYLKQFPIPTGLLGADCGQIGQSLIQLAAEKANLKQSDLDQLYTLYTENDLQQRMQVVSDLTTRFNGLYAQQNCTAAQAGGGNDVLKYVLYGVGVIFVVVIARKIMHGKHKVAAIGK